MLITQTLKCPVLVHGFGVLAAFDTFSVSWRLDNNVVVPPLSLVCKALKHMRKCRATGTLAVLYWPSTKFYPLLGNNESNFETFAKD